MDKRERSGEALFLRSDSDSSRMSSGGVVAVEATGGSAAALLHDLHAAAAGRMLPPAPDARSYFQPTWREVSARMPSEECLSGANPEVEALEKGFNAALLDYFDVDGSKQCAELRLNTAAPSTRRGPPSSSSDFRGVTRHRRTKKWESHIWYNKKQLYLGGFKVAMDAAKAHDIMGLKLKKSLAHTNFEPQGYGRLMPFLEKLSMESVMESLRMCSKGNGPNKLGMKSRTRHTRPQSLPRFPEEDGLACPAMTGSHPLDLDPGFHQLSGAPETIRATLLPRTWSGSNRTVGGKQGGLHLDHRLPLGTMNDYMPLPGNLNGSCEVLDGSQGSMFCKTEGEQCSNPFMLSNHPQDVFMMDMPGNGCNGRRAYESDGEQCLPHDDKNQILVTIPQTRSDHYMVPMALTPPRRIDGTPPHLDSSLQELLGGSTCASDHSTGTVANNAYLQTPDAVILKVPVIPSKVIRYPQTSLIGSSFTPHMEYSLPASLPGGLQQGPLDTQNTRFSPVQANGNAGFTFGLAGGKSGTPGSDTGESASMEDASY